MKKLKLFTSSVVMGLTSFSVLSVAVASVPRGKVTDDTAIYQNLSEIRVQKQADLNFDSDIAQLSAAEHRFKEKLPTRSQSKGYAQSPRLRGPMQRVSAQKYQFSGKRSSVAKRQ